jgi:hypothetical protein
VALSKDLMKRCMNCLKPMRDIDAVCGACGEGAPPVPDRARLMSVVVDSVIGELNLLGGAPLDEEQELEALELLLALKRSPAYAELYRKLARLPLESALSSAAHLGWVLRAAVQSNWWDHLPKVSDLRLTETLRQMNRELRNRR